MLSLGNKLTLTTQPIYKFVNKYSIDFDGVDDCIVTDGADTVLQNTTYSFWCKSSTTAQNKGVFGHGGDNQGAFHFNWSGGNRPLLYLGSSYYVFWGATTKMSDGEWHHWVVYSEPNNLNNCKLYCDGVLQTPAITDSGSLEAFTESLTIGGDQASGVNYFEGKIDEFAVYDRELTQDEITRMYNTYYSPNRVANGNFSQIGNEEVTNGDFSQIGSELVTNGDFATDSNWVKQTGWSIANGLASSDGSQSLPESIYQNGVTVVGKIYKITYTIVSRTSGSVRAMAGSLGGTYQSTPNTYIEYLTATGNVSIGIQANADFVGSIDNVSVKEVGQGWEFNGESELTPQGSRVLSTAGSQSFVKQNSILVIGKSYKVTFDVISTDGTNLVDNSGNSWGTSTTGAKTIYYTATGDFLMFKRGGVTDVTITNISVKEVGQHWTFGTGWSTDGTKAIFTATGSYSNLTQGGAIIGRTYKITFDATRSAGTLYVKAGSNGTFTAISSDGSYSISSVAAGDTNFYFQADTTFAGTVDNIVVQELKHDATNLMLNAGAYQSANPLITSTKSMEFDGTDDYLQVSSFSISGEKTYSLWFNTTSTDANVRLINLPADTGFINLTINAGKLNTFDGTNNPTTTTTWNDGKWHNGVLVMKTNDVKIYVDGVSQTLTWDAGSSPNFTIQTATNQTLDFGKGGSSYFDGKVTEAGVYDRALTSLEVASLYNQGMPTNLLVNRNNYQSGNPTVFNTKQVDFDGTDDKLVFNTPSAFSGLGLNSFDCTLSAWAKFDTIGQFEALVSLGTYDLEIAPLTATDVGIWVDNAGLSTTYTPTMGEWNHYVATKSGNTYSLYVDGVLIGSDTDSDNATIGTQSFIGSNGAGNYFDGDISQIGLWNSTLTADEVSSLYNHGLPIDLTTDQAAYESSSNLVGYWRMGSGTLDSYPLIADQTNATLGSELLTDGNFPTGTTAFSVGSNWSIANNKASYDNLGSSSLIQNLTFESGKTYQIEFDVLDFTSNYRFDIYTGVSFIQSAIITDKTSFKIYFVGDGGSYIRFRGLTTGSFAIKNLSVKKVNGNPAIMTNQTSSDIENGSPYANTVQYPNDFSQYSYGGTAPTLTTGQLAPDGTLTATKVSGVLNSTSLYRDSESSTTASRSIYARTVSGTGTVNLMSYGGNTNNNFTITEEWQKFELTGSIATGGSNFYAVDFRFPGVNPLTELIIWGGNSQEPNTGLQGYWKMGDGTNDEYPVIYDQTNPTLGVELVTNGDGSSTTGWSLAYPNTTLSINNNHLRATANASGAYGLSQSLSLDTSKEYIIKATINVDNASGGAANLRFATNSNLSSNVTTLSSATGTSTTILSPSAATMYIGIVDTANDSSNYVEIDNISVKEISGNPATMTNMVEGNITNQYPLTKIRNYYRMGDGILDGYPIIQDQTSPNLAHIPTTNIITYSEDLSVLSKVSVGTASAPVTTSNYATAPDGTQTATRVVFNLNGGTSSGDRSILRQAIPSGSNYYFSIYVKSTDGTEQKILWHDGGEYNLTTVTNEWVRITYDGRPNSAYAGIALRGGEGVDSSDILAWGFQVEDQSQATAYIKSDGIAGVRKSTTTNLLPYSEDFSTYTPVGGIVVEGNQTDPNGNNTAYKLSNFSANNSRLDGNTSTTAVDGVTYTYSAYYKGSGTIRINCGTSTGVGGSSEKDIILTNEWTRQQVTFTASSPTGVVKTHAAITRTPNNDAIVYLAFAQIEEQTQAETYAKTTGLPVTIDLFTENNYGTMTNMSASDIIEDTP